MQLLYCKDGLVHAVHDDAAAAIHPSVYFTGGGAVRVIPWPDPLWTLTKVGTAPGPGWGGFPTPDTRPYAEPTETPDILKRYAAQQRYQAVAGGLDFPAASGTVPVKGDRMSWMLIGNLAHYAGTLQPTDIVNFTQDNIDYPLTAAECQTLFLQFSQLLETCRSEEATCLADLNSATPTIKTYADVEARFTSVAGRYRKDTGRWF
jgi:hypothetical protein